MNEQRQMIAPQEVTTNAATWKDLPDAPGLWMCMELRQGRPIRFLYDVAEVDGELRGRWICDYWSALYVISGVRWYGPLPPDTAPCAGEEE